MDFYIYLHIKQTTGEPFYIGKGKGNRCKQKTGRNNHWYKLVDKYGFDVIMLEENLTEQEAFELEKYWINRIGRFKLGNGPLINMTDGGEGCSGKEPWNKGKKWSEDARKKMSLSSIGQKAWNKGKKYTDEEKKLMSIQQKGKKHSEQTRKKMSNSRTGGNNVRAKLVLDTETGIFYESASEAAIAKNINQKTLGGQLRGTNKNKTKLKYV